MAVVVAVAVAVIGVIFVGQGHGHGDVYDYDDDHHSPFPMGARARCGKASLSAAFRDVVALVAGLGIEPTRPHRAVIGGAIMGGSLRTLETRGSLRTLLLALPIMVLRLAVFMHTR